MKYGVYHREREWARVNGDPLLGVVEANSIDEAQVKASKGFHELTGVTVWPLTQQKEQ